MEELNLDFATQEQGGWIELDVDDFTSNEETIFEEPTVEEEKTEEPEKEVEDKKTGTEKDETQVEEEEDKGDTDEKGEEEGEAATLQDYLEALKETEGLDDDVLENIETVEDLVTLQQELVNAKVEEQLNKLTEKIGDVGVNFLKYVANGGKPEDFFKNIGDFTEDNITFIEGDESNHEMIIKRYMKEKGYDDDDINDTIEGFKQANKLEEKAKQYFDKLDSLLQEKKKRLTEQEKKRREELEKRRKEFESTIKNKINEISDIAGYKMSSNEKKELQEYITRPKVQTQDGNFVSQFQKDLNELVAKPENLIILGLIAKNKFDLGFLKKKIETEVTKKTKKLISGSSIKNRKDNTNTSIMDLLDKL